MQYFAAVQATCRKQQTPPTLYGGAEEEVWIVLFYEVAPFEDNVSTILSPIADISNLSISMQLRSKD